MGRKSKRIVAGEQAAETSARSATHSEAATAYGRGESLLFALTLFVSAALLFTVQPMFAKMVLPRLGGAPAVWNACLVFYQALLLGGYLYAHLSLKWLGARRQAVVHLGLLALAWISLPVRIAPDWLPPATMFPAPALWLLLAISLGLPFLAVSASAPMLQAWFARIGKDTAAQRDPYFLYAASNLGSLLGLIGYPLVMEARLTLAEQSLSWAIGFGLLMALIAACAAFLWKKPIAASPPIVKPQEASAITPRRRLRWLALSLVPSSLLMGVTTYITSEITQLPALWVIPLALYLLTFVFVFAPRTVLPLKWMVRLQAPLIVLAATSLMFNVAGLREMLLLGSLHLAAFFVTAMVCHGQLAADRPEPARLTEFYLWMSLGGVLGGLFSALLAPLIFHQALEYPLMMAAACMLRPRLAAGQQRRQQRQDAIPAAALLLCLFFSWGLRTDAFLSGKHLTDGLAVRLSVLGLAAVAALLLMRRPIVFGTAVAAVAAVGLWSAEAGVQSLDLERSFFGILRVEYDSLWNTHQLLNGTTNHGVQSLYADQRREPQGYYHRTGPLGEIFAALGPRRPLAEVGVLGLGAGTVAAYAEPGERFTFYEIDPAVERIARDPNYFTYLADCRGRAEVVLGDARLSLERGPKLQFDLLILDVFSSDSVPVHLVTREALEVYCRRLAPHGILAFHVSSRYIELEPILGRLALAAEPGLTARVWRDRERVKEVGWFPSVWVVMAKHADDLGPLAQRSHWTTPECDPGRVWTDDFSNVMSTMHWRTTGFQLVPSRWLNSSRQQRANYHALLANSMLEMDRIDDAIDQLQRSLAIEPETAVNQYAVAYALASRGKTNEALEHYAKALILDPGHAAWHCDYGAALAKLQKDDDATKQFHEALKLDPHYAEAFINLGNVLLRRKKVDEALETYRQVIAAAPQNAEIRYHLGLALMQLGNIPKALGEFRAALPLAEAEKNDSLIEKIPAEIRRCENWPWDKDDTEGKAPGKKDSGKK